MLVVVVVWVIVCLAALAAPAAAGPSSRSGRAARSEPEHAAELASYRDAVAAGTEAFRQGHFSEARGAFERAFAIHPDHVLLFNIASCWRREGQAAQAVAAYLRFLDLAPVGDPRRALATDTVATLQAELAATTALAQPGDAAEAPPIAGDPEPRIEITPEPAAEPLPAAPAPPRRGRSKLRPIGIGVTAVGLLVIAGGGIEALRARSLEQDVEGFRGPWNRDEADAYNQGRSTARRAIILTAAGAVVVGGGLTLFYLGNSRERAVRIGAAPASGGAAAVIAGRF